MSVPNERYSWNVSCALMLTFTFLLFQKRVVRNNANIYVLIIPKRAVCTKFDIYVFIIPETLRVH